MASGVVQFVNANAPDAGLPPEATDVAVDITPSGKFQKVKLFEATVGSEDPIGIPSKPIYAADTYTAGEVLADQIGAGAVLTFTFANPMDLVWVVSEGADLIARVDPFGGTPSVSAGVPIYHETPAPITLRVTVIKVFAPTGTTISVWGFRYA